MVDDTWALRAGLIFFDLPETPGAIFQRLAMLFFLVLLCAPWRLCTPVYVPDAWMHEACPAAQLVVILYLKFSV